MKNTTKALHFAGPLMLILVLGAFTLQPISREFSPSGAQSSQVFQVHNPANTPVALRVEMLERQVDPNGVESNPSARADFTVFPTQFVLEPGQRRNIRVRYTGPENIERERSYRLLAEQLPVDLNPDETAVQQEAPDASGGSIQIVFRYMASIFVVPSRAAPADIEIEWESVPAEGELRLRLSNSGGRHILLHDFEAVLELDDGSEMTLSDEQLRSIRDTNLLAGATRVQALPLSEDLLARLRDLRFEY